MNLYFSVKQFYSFEDKGKLEQFQIFINHFPKSPPGYGGNLSQKHYNKAFFL